MMTYEEALQYIHAVSWKGSRPGLERITELMERLGNVQNKLRYIHVAGTNGKGSTCVMTERVLRCAGYRTGLFTSPFLWDFRERIVIDGKPVSEELLSACTEAVREQADRMADPPTEFELITAIGILCFIRSRCDLVVFECGMGGRLDSTNVIRDAVLSVICGIALDHTAFLGDTEEKIAYEKAGIIKADCPVIYGGRKPHVAKVIAARAKELNSPYYENTVTVTETAFSREGTVFSAVGEKSYDKMHLSLCGSYQPQNASLVIRITEILNAHGFSVSESALRRGLSNVFWPGRFECLHQEPCLFYDGGHNPQGIAACIDSIEQCLHTKQAVILSGVMRDKDYRQMVSLIAPVAACAVTLTPDNPRSLPAEEYAAAFRDAGIEAVACRTAEEAVQAAYCLAQSRHLPVVALGSLYMYGQIRSAVCRLAQAEGTPLPHAPLGEET